MNKKSAGVKRPDRFVVGYPIFGGFIYGKYLCDLSPLTRKQVVAIQQDSFEGERPEIYELVPLRKKAKGKRARK